MIDTTDITSLSSDQLMELRGRIDVRLDEIKNAFVEQARKLGLEVAPIATGKKRRGRRPRKNSDDALPVETLPGLEIPAKE